jgi:hypothetical protein
MRWYVVMSLAIGAGCGEAGGGDGDGDGDVIDAGPIDIDDVLWAPLDLDGAPDLGHAPRPVANPVEPGEIDLPEVGDQVGLGGSVGGGNAHGVGIGAFDIDGDGFDDIFVVNGIGGGTAHPSQVYLNDGTGNFTDFTAQSGVAAILAGVDGYSIAAADYDADGDLDAYVTAHPRDFLLRNDGNGVFTDVTTAAGAGGPRTEQFDGSASKIAAWGDYDNDGDMDVVVASSNFEDFSQARGNCSGDQCTGAYLLANNGDGTFTDVTLETGVRVSQTGNPCAVMWSDMDNDGDQDLWVFNDRGDDNRNRAVLRNDGGVFIDVTEEARVTHGAGNPMGIDAADIDHDGDLDYYISDIGGNELYLNNGDGTFRERAAEASVLGSYGWGLGFEDLNGDTWADIFVAQEDDRPYLSFRNQRTNPPAFVEQAWEHSPVGNGHNTAVAFADFDRDGTIDVVTASTSGSRLNYFRNDTDLGTQRYLEVVVPETPETGSFGGISGRVVVATGDLIQFRDLTGGSSRASQNAMSVRFGLGQYTGADFVAVMWPDGRQTAVVNVEGNQRLAMPPP